MSKQLEKLTQINYLHNTESICRFTEDFVDPKHNRNPLSMVNYNLTMQLFHFYFSFHAQKESY